jgi:ABC-type antimicrobial peptide transport system permease subunit
MLAVIQELNYDSFNTNYKRIYRVLQDMPFTKKATWAITQGPLGPALLAEIPEIEQVTRTNFGGWSIKYEEEEMYSYGLYVDPSFLDIFSYELMYGSKNSVLSNPYSVILTQELALKIFGDKDPIGKIITVYDQYEVEVTGIMKDPPSDSHLKFEWIGTMEHAKEIGYTVDYWKNSTFYTYVLLPEESNFDIIEEKVSGILDDKPTLEEGAKLRLQPLSEIHLSTGIDFENADVGDKNYVYIFLSAAFFILVIACINFMNLTTARSIRRAKEIGMRKVVGASRKHIIFQFLTETGTMIVFSLIISVLLINLILPFFNQAAGENLSLDLLNYKTLIGFLALTAVTILLSGFYPAFYMSSIMPSKIIKGMTENGMGNSRLKQIMVIIQFITSIVLLVGSYAVFNQVKFLQTKDLGYTADNIIYLPINNNIRKHFDSFKNDLAGHSNISSLTSTSSFPSKGYVFSNNLWDWSGKDPNYDLLVHNEFVDYNYFKTFEIELKEGRSFSVNFPSDTNAVILNEKAVELMGLNDPVGKTILYDGESIFTIIGISKNYNFRSLHSEIGPLVLFLNPVDNNYLWLKVNSQDFESTISFIEQKWKSYNPENAFWYNFLDQQIKRLYENEKTVGIVLSGFSLLAIILLCLGIFGLIGYSVTQRYKEISIRKIFGAETSTIIWLFTKEYAKLMLIATAIGIPVINYLLQEWLRSFPYRIEIRIFVFLLPVLILFIISMSIIYSQSLRATRINAAETLRNE